VCHAGLRSGIFKIPGPDFAKASPGEASPG